VKQNLILYHLQVTDCHSSDFFFYWRQNGLSSLIYDDLYSYMSVYHNKALEDGSKLIRHEVYKIYLRQRRMANVADVH
jgi:hypothetical protein